MSNATFHQDQLPGAEQMRRTVFHFEVPDFAVTVERVRDRSLATRPVIIAPPGNPRGSVQAISPEARQEGITSGMRLGAAQRLCPRAVILPPDPLLYRRAAGALVKLLGRFTPVAEGDRHGRFFLDMTGTNRLLGPPRDAAARILRDATAELRLAAIIGIAANKAVSRVASSVVQADLLDVLPGSEEQFLSPWAIKKLPGTEEVTDSRLFEELNIRRIGQLTSCAVCHLAAVFGRMGPVLHQRARGIDPRPVLPPRRERAVREEEILSEETNCRELLLSRLRILTARGGHRLRRAGLAARTVALQIGYSDNLLLGGHARLTQAASGDAALLDAVRPLFTRVAHRRVRVRYLALAFVDLYPALPQLSLFPAPEREVRDGRLTRTLDRIRERFGGSAIQTGAVHEPSAA
jgi:DNA polymerase-4